MSQSIRSSSPRSEKRRVPRFHRLDIAHISAIESLYRQYPFLNERVEIHMPFHRSKPTFSSQAVWVWPKFDKRPVGYLIFLEGFAPCIWYPDRQEGMTFRWLLPPTFCEKGPTVCLANILAGESLLQIEDIVIYQGANLWSSSPFSQRWNILREFWISLPADQPLLAFQPRIVKPMTIEEWELAYDPSIYWIIQPDHCRQPRWYWKDVVTVPAHKPVPYVAPKLKRDNDLIVSLYAICTPYTKLALPDTYSLTSQEGNVLGIASVATIQMSTQLREQFTQEKKPYLIVEVNWNEAFRKYQITRIMPSDTPTTPYSFFHHQHTTSSPTASSSVS